MSKGIKDLTNEDLYILRYVLEQTGNLEDASNDYLIYVHTNVDIIKERIDSLDKLKEKTEEYKKYHESKCEIDKKYCEKLDSGEVAYFVDDTFTQPATNDGVPKVKDKHKAAYDKELEVLREEHKKVVDAHEKKMDKFKDTLAKAHDPVLPIKRIPHKLLPKIPTKYSYEFTKILMPILKIDI